MRIGLDLRMADQDYGIGRYSLELARHMIAADKTNSYVLFVRSPDKFAQTGLAEFSNVKLIKADFRHYSFSEQLNFTRILNAANLDLVHFMNFNVPVRYNRPFVATIHDVIHHKLPGNKPSRFLHRMAYRYVINNAARKALRIITVSNYSKKEIMETLRVHPDKIKVIYEAASPIAVSDSDVIAIRQKYGLNKDYIIFVGVMERKKNILGLARGFDWLKENYRLNIQLALVGKVDSYYPEILDQAKKIKYAKDLRITGIVSDKEKYALYKGSLAFVSASLYEGFGLPGVEAMSLGVPLVVANTEVFNEVYDNGAIYFDPNSPADIAEKLNLLLKDSKYRQLISNNAYVRSQFFSWQKAAAQTLELYQEIAEQGGAQ